MRTDFVVTHDHIIMMLLAVISAMHGAIICLVIAAHKSLTNKIESSIEGVRAMKAHMHNFMVSQFMLMKRLHPHNADVIAESMGDWFSEEKTNGKFKGGAQ